MIERAARTLLACDTQDRSLNVTDRDIFSCADWAGLNCRGGGRGITGSERISRLVSACPISCADVDCPRARALEVAQPSISRGSACTLSSEPAFHRRMIDYFAGAASVFAILFFLKLLSYCRKRHHRTVAERTGVDCHEVTAARNIAM